MLTGQAESRVMLQPPEEESKSLCSVIVNSCAQHLKLFRVRTQEKSCSDAKLSRVAGFRVCEFVLSCLSICQARRFCRNVPFAMSSREVNIRALQRSWARRPKFAIPLPPPPDAQAQYSCPTCGSENTQRLSTVYMAGVSQFSAVTSGFGWAGGPAGGSGWTEGTSQTQLSLLAAPPKKRSYWPGFGLIAVSPLLSALAAEGIRRISGQVQLTFRFEDLATGSFFVLAIVAFLLLMRAFRYNRRTWPMLLLRWNMSFTCSRCGRVFIPGVGP